jgi:glycosyltransferase involved in cell wall biosynthesis
MERIKHIVLITSGQPTTNPRLVKEADALCEAGFQVTVLYQYLSKWATECDEILLKKKRWSAVQVGGTPFSNKLIFNLTRIIRKLAYITAKYFSFKSGIAELAIGRCFMLLYQSAKAIHADLYIAHNLAALPVAVKAGKYHNTKVGFDAEDFHRYELSNSPLDLDVRLKIYMEEKYIPQLTYLTGSSPEISKKYSHLFKIEVPTILNVFPKTDQSSQPNFEKPLKLLWFSQTIGPNRGIETIIEALNLVHFPFELHLLGNPQEDFLTSCYTEANFDLNCIHLHKPISPKDLFGLSSLFDVGLATESGFSINNELALSNKIFTYIQSGLSVIASNTIAQEKLLITYPQMGMLFEKNNAHSLAEMLKKYNNNRTLLNQHKADNYELGQLTLNWEKEQNQFLSIVNQTLDI